MEHSNGNAVAKKRVRRQQNFISVLCLACIVFSFVWGIHIFGDNVASVKTGGTASPGNINVVNSSSSSSDSTTKKVTTKVTTSKKADSSSSKSSSSKKADDTSSKTDSSETDSDVHKYDEPNDTKDDLSDTLFIGDSRTVGLMNNCQYPKATFYCSVGMHVDKLDSDKIVTLDNGNTVSVMEALKLKQYKRIYINLGTNELGWPYPDVFRQAYEKNLTAIKKLQPNAKIYAESILPVSASKDAEGTTVNNKNVVKFNKLIKQAAANTGCEYLNCLEAIADSKGYLPAEATTDGVHLVSDYCTYWLNYIIDKT